MPQTDPPAPKNRCAKRDKALAKPIRCRRSDLDFHLAAKITAAREGPPSDGRQVRKRRKQFGRRGAR